MLQVKPGFIVKQQSQKSVIQLRIRPAMLVGSFLACLLLFAVSAAAEDRDTQTGTPRVKPQLFLETGLFAGTQTNTLIWAQGNARANANLLYLESGVDLEWSQVSDQRGHGVGVALSVDMGGESGSRPRIGLGPRIHFSISSNWALQAQAGILFSGEGETECSNSLGSVFYGFRGGHQARVGLLYRNTLSFNALWRALDYDADLYSVQQPRPPQRSSGTANLFCAGIMLHGKTGTYASLGSLLCMAILTAVLTLGEAGG